MTQFAAVQTLGYGLWLGVAAWAAAQDQLSDAALVFEGTVERTYEQTGTEENVLVQILVQRSQTVSANQPRHARAPAPGEFLFVALEPGMERPGNGATIEGRLVPSVDGGWTGASHNWFARSKEVEAESVDRLPGNNRQPGDDRQPGDRELAISIRSLGLQGERMELKGDMAVRVTQLAPGGAAKAAGLEIGDIIVGVDGQKLTAESLETAARKRSEFTLSVIDINSGRVARVPVKPQAAIQSDSHDGNNFDFENDLDSGRPRTSPPTYSLGLTAEDEVVEGRPALKIVRIQPDSAAARAGLEKGDVLVKIDGRPIANIQTLVNALKNSQGQVTLTVRDVRTGREIPVEVQLEPEGPSVGESSPSRDSRTDRDERQDANRVPDRGQGQPSPGLGISTDVAFNDNEVAVKITDVVPGGAGDRAGLTRGMLIVAANGKPVLHPNDLQAAQEAGGPLELTVVDSGTGRQRRITVRPQR